MKIQVNVTKRRYPKYKKRVFVAYNKISELNVRKKSVLYAFSVLILLAWLDEILDIPHWLLKAPSTPVNSREALIETIVIFLLGIWVCVGKKINIPSPPSQEIKLSNTKEMNVYKGFFRFINEDQRLVWVFIGLGVLVWLNEIVDIPHLLLKAPVTPINSREAVIETLGILGVGICVLLTVSRNSSASKRLQTELQESKQKFLILADQSLLGIAILQNDLFKYANKEFARLLGWSLKNILGWSLSDFTKTVHQDDRRQVEERFQYQQEGGAHGEAIPATPLPNYEYRLCTRSCATRWVEMFSKPILFGGEKAEMITLIDITAKKIAERTARQQQQQLIQADKLASLGILVSGVAHEINNPNQTIMSYAGLLKGVWTGLLPILDGYYEENGDFVAGGLNYSEVREEMRIYLEGIGEASRSISSIVGELKEYGRHTDYDLGGNVDINQVVKAAVTLSSNFMKRATRNFKVDLTKNLPRIRGNFQRLEQVVINLIENSCQALIDRRKGLYISTSYSAAKAAVEIRVVDEGIGIPIENITHIQDPFFTTKRNSGGTGLGLAISARIVEDHNGSLDFFSEPGSGTEAVVTVPLTVKRKEGEAS
jgi:PAS domain S-box-containing protein